MRSYLLKISSPDGDLFCDNAVNLCLRGTEGDLAVMAGHVPFVTYVKPCNCKIELEDGSEKIGYTQGGVLTVGRDKVILLSGVFTWGQ